MQFKYSDIANLFLPEIKKSVLVKKIKFQTTADYSRRYIGKLQATREFNASSTLISIGVKCPVPIGYAINFSPIGNYESLYICEYIEDSITGKEFLVQQNDYELRKVLLSTVAKDLAKIHRQGLFHKDSHLGNILCKNGSPTKTFWIDNDLQKIKIPIERYEKMALKRFKKIRTKNIISCQEWEYFVGCYFYFLNG